MTNFASQTLPASRPLAMQRQSGIKSFALGAIAFFSLAALAGAILVAALAHTAVALMRDDARPVVGDVFEGRVRLKSLDFATSENHIATLSRLPQAQ